MIEITNEDNMALMARYEDNHFDLAIVDPPYRNAKNNSPTKDMRSKQGSMKNWQDKPNNHYFMELFRVSKNQIIWGGNNFIDYLYNTSCIIFWNKNNNLKNFSDGELAWTSFKKVSKYFEYTWVGNIYGFPGKKEGVGKPTIKIHPTEKPVKLYEWLLMNYAKEGDRILDTHLGSGSIAIACHNLGFDLTACELDKEYFDVAMKRLKQHQQQLVLF